MQDITGALFEDRQGIGIAIEVTAGVKSEVFPAGYNEWRKTIGCRVSAPAREGKANRAVLALIAKTLELPVSSVSMQSGAASSLKRVLVTGISKKDLLMRLTIQR